MSAPSCALSRPQFRALLPGIARERPTTHPHTPPPPVALNTDDLPST